MLALGTWLLITAALRFWTADSKACHSSFPPDVWLTGAFTMITSAFLLGGLLGNLPHYKPGRQSVGVATQLGVTALVPLIAFALWYETRAAAGESLSMPPITHSVMCIKQQENDWTVLVFVLAALLMGR